MFLTGKRAKILTGDEEEIDRSFWGSEKHKTWEESESDSDISYDLEESEDESDSDSELDQVEGDDESGTEESVDEEENRRKRPRFHAYKVPPQNEGIKRKTVIRRKSVTQEPVETPSDNFEKRETRETTKARTLEVTERKSVDVSGKKRKHASRGSSVTLTQEEQMEEARIVEEWNKADYDAYLRYTEMSEKERNALMQKRRNNTGSKNLYKIITRSYIKDGEVQSELKIVPPLIEESTKEKGKRSVIGLKSVSDVLRINRTKPEPVGRLFRYRYPHGDMLEYNTVEEFKEIRKNELEREKSEAEAVVKELRLLLV